jgi:hydroxylamine reductase
MSAPNGCGSSGATIGTCGKDENLTRLQDTMIYALKGLSAYREHLNELEPSATKSIDDIVNESLYFTLTNVNFNFDEHINQLMKIGTSGVECMNALSKAHTDKFGIPTPVDVSQNSAQGKAILVSGHNLDFLHKLLEATKDKGINIYTHSEMLPAHGYPKLREYSHLKGNIGKAWFDQSKLFEEFKGTIVVNTNCIVPPKSSSTYLDRLYTYKIVGVEGAKKIENDNFDELITQTLSLDDVEMNSDATLPTGHHYESILTLAEPIVEAVKSGKIRRFFVIAGCDAPGSAGEYYRDLAKALPNNCVIITSSCGKFRFNDIDFGVVDGTDIPRYLDLGQCNDSNGAVHIALALADVFGVEVNELPVSIVLSWMEQKAVLILMSLFSLGIKNIYIGPKAPEFVNDDIYQFLSNTFNLKLTTDVEIDLQNMLK